MIVLPPQFTAKELKEELAAMAKAGKEINKTPESARAFLIKCGIVTKEGKLAKRFGG